LSSFNAGNGGRLDGSADGARPVRNGDWGGSSGTRLGGAGNSGRSQTIAACVSAAASGARVMGRASMKPSRAACRAAVSSQPALLRDNLVIA
jgi:hypothetical protein